MSLTREVYTQRGSAPEREERKGEVRGEKLGEGGAAQNNRRHSEGATGAFRGARLTQSTMSAIWLCAL